MILVWNGLHILNGSHLDARLEITAYYSLMATVLTTQSSLLTIATNIIFLFVSHHILPTPHNLSMLVCFNRLSTTMLRQLSKRHGPAAPISTKSKSCILSENRP